MAKRLAKTTPKKSLVKKKATGVREVPVADATDFVKVSNTLPPDTFVKVDGDRVNALVTTMPNGTRVAWDTCGRCKEHVRLCKCNTGIQVCRSIEYIYDHINATLAGEEWDHNHRNYKGTLLRNMNKRDKEPFWVGAPAGTKIGDPLPKPQKRLRKPLAKAPLSSGPVAKEAFDLGALNAAATASAVDMEQALEKKVMKKPVKKMRKIKK